jgi:antitoxin CptB
MTISTYPEPTAAASVRRPIAYGTDMDRDTRLKRLRFRAWHRGTKEADLLIGGFFDAHADGWSEAEIADFETLLEEQDVDIMAWAIGTAPVPERFEGPMVKALQTVSYVPIVK